jgi:penicillin-binding protein activator
MKKYIGLSISMALVLVFSSACVRQVTRINPDESVDISGAWNDVDSKLVAKKMVDTVLISPWLSNFTAKSNGKPPVIIAGMVMNRSHEHIEAETFVKDIESAMLSSSKVKLVAGGKKREEIRSERADQADNSSVSTMKKWGLEIGADYILQGTITSDVDSYRRKKVVTYKVYMELTDIQTNELVWMGEKKIKKFIKN